ncbi:hypothetical protein AB0D86_48745 [Streptomyces sp. NPDC048324]|uniref:hypothetical protein n=1 Tax=Streptomyces sp. NPDC048324 TaxID=3157205 RepID=UPI00342205C5
MPADHARKAAIRQRMARTGESYRQAARAIDRICASPEPPLCAAHMDPWECPEGCPSRETVRETAEYRAWLAVPRTRDECPGHEACQDPDCFNGCNDVYVRMCMDCLYVFDAAFDDPEDGRCPNGCEAFRFERAWLASRSGDVPSLG